MGDFSWYRFYASLTLTVVMCARCEGTDDCVGCPKTREHADRVKDASTRKVKLQVLADENQPLESVICDIRVWRFIDTYWRLVLIDKPDADESVELYDFNYVAVDLEYDVGEVTCSIKVEKDSLIDPQTAVKFVKRELPNEYDPALPLLVLPNIAYLIAPQK